MIKGFYLKKNDMPFTQKQHTAVVNTIILSGLIFTPLAFALTVLPFEIIERYLSIIKEMGLIVFLAENGDSFTMTGGNELFLKMVGTTASIGLTCLVLVWGSLRSLGLLVGNWKVNRGL